MRKFYLLFLIIWICKLGNAQFTDQFTDGGITNNPSWTGDISSFTVNVAKELQLNGLVSGGSAYVSTGSGISRSVQWDMYIRLTFNPSDNDYVKIYLFSNMANLSASNQAYYLKIGRNGASDGLEFYRQDGTNDVLLRTMLSSQLNSNPEFNLRVVKNNMGKWVFHWKNIGTTEYSAIDSLTETTYTTTNYFGLFCQYTGANATSFYFDDINVVQLPDVNSDVTPPVLSSVVVNTSTQIDAVFSESVANPMASVSSNYGLNPTVAIQSAVVDPANPQLVHLTLVTPLSSNTVYTLTANTIQDLAGNTIVQNTSNFTTAYFAQAHDILINEIMAKPNPAHGLPDKQYIELKNTTAFPIDLAGWLINGASITSGNIAPGGLAIVCNSTDVAFFNGFGNVVAVSGLPQITNNISLVSNENIVIDSLTFDDSWYQSATKQNGGWSLEQYNQGYESGCERISFWAAAINTNGGTPGSTNHGYSTVNISAQVTQITANTIEVRFGGSLNATEAANAANYVLDNGITISLVTVLQNNSTVVNLKLTPDLAVNTLYSLTVKDMNGCAGVFHPQENLDVAITRPPVSGELLLNEILHYPKSGTSDFVEIYNPTNIVFSLKDIHLLREDPISGVATTSDFSTSIAYIKPYNYLVVTPNKAALLHDYPNAVADNVIESTALPDYGIREDVVVLKNKNNEEIDRLHFTEKWHFSLLKTYQGVSLERTNEQANREEKTNWKSAAESAGFATPGYLNSTFTDIALDNNIHIKPEVFSPDQNGVDDEFVIEYNFETVGMVASVHFYDVNGRSVRSLISNKILPKEGYFIWDGTTDNGEKAKVGIYLMVFEIKDTNGNTKRTKKKCVVAAQF